MAFITIIFLTLFSTQGIWCIMNYNPKLPYKSELSNLFAKRQQHGILDNELNWSASSESEEYDNEEPDDDSDDFYYEAKRASLHQHGGELCNICHAHHEGQEIPLEHGKKVIQLRHVSKCTSRIPNIECVQSEDLKLHGTTLSTYCIAVVKNKSGRTCTHFDETRGLSGKFLG